MVCTCAAAAAQRLLTAVGQRRDGQRRQARHHLELLSDGREGGGLRVNAIRAGEVLAAGWEGTVPVGEADSHLAPEVKAFRDKNK